MVVKHLISTSSGLGVLSAVRCVHFIPQLTIYPPWTAHKPLQDTAMSQFIFPVLPIQPCVLSAQRAQVLSVQQAQVTNALLPKYFFLCPLLVFLLFFLAPPTHPSHAAGNLQSHPQWYQKTFTVKWSGFLPWQCPRCFPCCIKRFWNWNGRCLT